ncbi:nuclear transport factor 2 family protein [Gammaproteobacteria bacterium]|nr:nuclear transport factor 2 family protein [Gammaproteobacteria bacterium]
MIRENIKKWHDHIKGEFPGGLDDLLADDVIFYSPIVFSPQNGKELTTLYLMAAGNTFGGDKAKDGTLEGSSFKYTKEILEGNQAMLEFETQIDGKYINGVDIITFNESGKISEFKVMIRPLQAVQIIHEQMQKMLIQFKNNEQI